MTSDSGMAVSEMNVVRKLSRNRNRTMSTSTAPIDQRLADVVDAPVDEVLELEQVGVRAPCRRAATPRPPAARP